MLKQVLVADLCDISDLGCIMRQYQNTYQKKKKRGSINQHLVTNAQTLHHE